MYAASTVVPRESEIYNHFYATSALPTTSTSLLTVNASAVPMPPTQAKSGEKSTTSSHPVSSYPSFANRPAPLYPKISAYPPTNRPPPSTPSPPRHKAPPPLLHHPLGGDTSIPTPGMTTRKRRRGEESGGEEDLPRELLRLLLLREENTTRLLKIRERETKHIDAFIGRLPTMLAKDDGHGSSCSTSSSSKMRAWPAAFSFPRSTVRKVRNFTCIRP